MVRTEAQILGVLFLRASFQRLPLQQAPDSWIHYSREQSWNLLKWIAMHSQARVWASQRGNVSYHLHSRHMYLILWLSHIALCSLQKGLNEFPFVNPVSVHLTPCGFWGSNSGCQAWQQAPSPTEPSQQPEAIFKTKSGRGLRFKDTSKSGSC